MELLYLSRTKKSKGSAELIRKAEITDIPYIREIYNDAVLNTTATFDLEPRTMEEMEKWFHRHTGKHIILIYEDQGIPVAYASFSTYRERPAFDASVEFSIYVHKDFQKQGIGRELTSEMLQIAKDDSRIHNIISLITSENETSIKMHKAFGFSFCGRIEDAGFKFGRYLHLDAYQLINK